MLRAHFQGLTLALTLAAGLAHAQSPVPEPEAAGVAKATFDKGQLVPSVALDFKTASDELQAESKPGIAGLVALIQDRLDLSTIRVEGHVGSLTGGEADTLGGKRALAVTKALVAAGVDCKRLLPVTFGAHKPNAEKGSASNTRVELNVAGLRGRAIGGMPLDGGGLVVGDACAK